MSASLASRPAQGFTYRLRPRVFPSSLSRHNPDELPARTIDARNALTGDQNRFFRRFWAMQQAIRDLFGRYEKETSAALGGAPDMAAISDLYEDAFIGAAPAGVIAGNKDEDFRKAIATGFARNREIGARQMEVAGLQADEIDAMHALVRVDWRATYDRDGRQMTIDFTNVYLTRLANGKCRVFGWITGDEEAELRKQGIV
jgi:hypothetical protein